MTPETKTFPIIRVPDDAADRTEAMGTKPKFWYHDSKGSLYLYKEARPETGEDWAEKIAAELAALLGLPHAEYELAVCRETPGIISPSFVPERGRLIHGNELLLFLLSGYPGAGGGSKNFYKVSQHTIDIVLKVVGMGGLHVPIDWDPPPDVLTPLGVFIGFLLLDAWIGNQDRHHQNWGLVFNPVADPAPRARLHLAPTFDHASSLGRNESDETREARLQTGDPGYSVQAYVERGRSALFAREGDSKPLTTFEAFKRAAERDPKAGRAWLDRLATVSQDTTLGLLDRVPGTRISPIAVEFAQKMLELNQRRLVRLTEVFP